MHPRGRHESAVEMLPGLTSRLPGKYSTAAKAITTNTYLCFHPISTGKSPPPNSLNHLGYDDRASAAKTIGNLHFSGLQFIVSVTLALTLSTVDAVFLATSTCRATRKSWVSSHSGFKLDHLRILRHITIVGAIAQASELQEGGKHVQPLARQCLQNPLEMPVQLSYQEISTNVVEKHC